MRVVCRPSIFRLSHFACAVSVRGVGRGMVGREGKEDGDFRLEMGRRGVCLCVSVVCLYALTHTHTGTRSYEYDD